MERPQLSSEIISQIGPNADNRITGTVLRNILLKIVDGTQLNLKGTATADFDPPDAYDDTFAPVYVASGTGTWTHFDAIELDNEIALLRLTDEGWIKDTITYLDQIEFPQVVDLLAQIQPVIDDLAAILAVGDTLTEIIAVYAKLDDIEAVSTSLTSIATTATNIAAIQTAATNIAAILAAPGHATTASEAASVATAKEALAEKWAENPEDVAVESGKYSALHHAAKAEGFADEAQGYKDDAAGSASSAAAVVSTEIPNLLANFFDPSVMALSARATLDSATVIRKLRYVQSWLDELAAAGIEPSLAYMPAVSKVGKIHSVLPADGTGDFSVTRAGTTAYTQNPDGTWRPAVANEPRYRYVNGVPVLIVEAAATRLNDTPYSFASNKWTKSGAKIEGDPSTAGADILAGWDFTNWAPSAVTVVDNNTFTAIISGGGISKAIITTGKLYRVKFSGTIVNGTIRLGDWNLGGFYNGVAPLSGTFSIDTYFYSLGTLFSVIVGTIEGTLQLDVTNFELYEVTGFSGVFTDANGVNLKNAYKLVATSANGSIKLATPVTTVAGTSYVNSIYIKRITGTGAVSLVDVNNTDRAVTVTNDWTRVEYAAAAAGTTGRIGVKLATSGDEVMICYAPIQAGTVASSPIGGAEGSTQTRNLDEIKDTDDYSSVKTLVINNDAYVINTALPNNGYTLEQKAHEKILMFDTVLSDAVIAARGWTKRQLAFSAYINVVAGTSVAIQVDGVGYIDWGDGTTDSYSSQVSKTKVYTGGYKGLIKFVGTLTRFYTASNANWYFDIADLPSVMTYFRCDGSNTITGDIADLPDVMTYFRCVGSNTITGDIADLPDVMDTFLCYGSNTITGDIADLPDLIIYFACSGFNSINTYTNGRTWANNQSYFFIRQATGYGLDSTEVDNLLIDFANIATWAGTKTIDIKGANAARTSASNAAVATLQGKGVTVLTN